MWFTGGEVHVVSYVIQFVAGTQDLVRASLAASLKGFRVIHHDDSAVPVCQQASSLAQ